MKPELTHTSTPRPLDAGPLTPAEEGKEKDWVRGKTTTPHPSEPQLSHAVPGVGQFAAGGQFDLLGAVREVGRHVALGLGTVSVEHLWPAVVANGGPAQLQVVGHAVVVHCLGVAARRVLEVLRGVVHALGVLVELRGAVGPDRLEEVPATPSNLLAQCEARPRVLALVLAQHELLTRLLTIFP